MHRPLIALVALAACSAQPDSSTPAAPSTAEQPAYGAESTSQPPPDAATTTSPPATDTSPPPPPATSDVPEGFRGAFAGDQQACGQAGHESRLELSADRIQFHESSGLIEQVHVTGNTLHLVARLTGEGETREAIYRFELLQDGRQLRDLDHGIVRVRCP